MLKYQEIFSKKRIESASLNLISIKNFKYFHPQSDIDHSLNRETHYYPSNLLEPLSNHPLLPRWAIEKKGKTANLYPRKKKQFFHPTILRRFEFNRRISPRRRRYISMTPNPFGIVRAEFLHGRPRHAIFTVPGGEGIEASKRRTLDTTRHLTCSAARLRKPLSGVSYLFRDTVLRDPIGARSPLSPLPLSRSPHPISPFESRRRPLSLSRPSVRDLLAIQNLRILVALPAYWWCTHTRTCARAYTHARVDLYCA